MMPFKRCRTDACLLAVALLILTFVDTPVAVLAQTKLRVPLEYNTIQSALDAAQPGDTVLVSPGSYVEILIWPSVDGIKLIGEAGSAKTTIDGQGNGSVILFPRTAAVGPSTQITGFTITGGDADRGGGIRIEGSHPTLSDLTLEENQGADFGSGLYAADSDFRLTGSKVAQNAGSRGAIHVINGSPLIENVIVSDNLGTGININSGDAPRLQGISIYRNAASHVGGGLITQGPGAFILRDISIAHNRAPNEGGGWYNLVVGGGSSIDAARLTIVENESGSEGDGIYDYSGSVHLKDANISRNGFGAYNNSSDGQITSITNAWWGATSGPYHPTENTLGEGDSTSTLVIIEPLATGPVAEAPPVPPYDVGAESVTPSSVTVRWAAAPMFDLLGYRLYWRRSDGNPSGFSDSSAVVSDTSLTITGLEPGKSYEITVRALDTAGQMSAPSGLVRAQAATPKTLTVPDDFAAIQDALNAAQTGDTVLVRPGLYDERLLWPDVSGVSLISAGDSSNTIVDAGGNGSVLTMQRVTAPLDSTTIIQGFTLRNGAGVRNGGGIFLNDASPLVDGLLIANNSAENGGGLYVGPNSNPIIRRVRVEDNEAWDGGGIYVDTSSPTIEQVQVLSNRASGSWGGGIMLNESAAIICSVEIIGNILTDPSAFAATLGGGLAALRGAPLIERAVVRDNVANRGGGIALQLTDAHLRNVWVEGNEARDGSFGGGGIRAFAGAPILENVDVFNNSAPSSGGIQFNTLGGSLRDVMIVGNKAIQEFERHGKAGGILFAGNYSVDGMVVADNVATYGGGVYITGDNATTRSTFTNVSIVNNEASYGGGLYVTADADPSMTRLTMSQNRSSLGFEGAYVDNGTPEITGANFVANGTAFHNQDNLRKIPLPNNWWGDSSGPHNPLQNPSGRGDSTNAFVDVVPFLSGPVSEAPPPPPGGVRVRSVTTSTVALSWNPMPLSDLQGYRVFWTTEPGPTLTFQDSSEVTTDTSLTVTGLVEGMTYFLSVVTEDADGNLSWYSARAQAMLTFPAISPSTGHIDFGDVLVDAEESETMSFLNGGTANLEITALSLATDAFRVSSGETTVEPGQAANVRVFFAPKAEGEYADTLTVHSNADTLKIPVTGIGVRADISVQPAVLAFGQIFALERDTLAAQVSNSGSAPLKLDSLVVSSSVFRLFDEPSEVEAGGRADINVVFSPNVVGTYTDTLHIYSNAHDGPERVGLTGKAESPLGIPVVPEHPFLDFGNVMIGTTDTLTAQIHNFGDVAALVHDAQTSSEIYRVLQRSGAVPPKGVFEVPIAFVPRDKGVIEDTLEVYTNVDTDPLKLALRGEVTTGVARESDRGIPTEFRLRQNYPNPFNPTTTLAYDVPVRANVRIEVIDVLGRLVKMLVDGAVLPGSHTVSIDMRGRPSGVYFLRMEAEYFQQVRQFVLLR